MNDLPSNTIGSGHGGKRQGAGRKPGRGPHGEPTKVMRIPLSKVTLIKQWLDQRHTTITSLPEGFKTIHAEQSIDLPLFSHKIAAGFPSPADDNLEETIDLNAAFVQSANTSFVVRVQGDSMKNAGILHGDQLVVDRSIEPTSGKIVIASIDGDLTVKRLERRANKVWLYPDNPAFQPIEIGEESELIIWGVVVSVLRKLN